MKMDVMEQQSTLKGNMFKVSIPSGSGKIQCPICGIVCKTKESYLKHTEKRHIKNH